MKLNFRKIASVISSAVMVTSTVALAAAANFPAPFVSNGAADVAVVYGSSAAVASTDLLAVADVQRALSENLAQQTATGGSTSGVTAAGGDYVKIETGSSKLTVGQPLTSVRTTVIGASDMPSLLKKITYQSKDGVSYDYEQEVQLSSNLNYTYFADIDYNNRMPTLGISKTSGQAILNYTARFIKTVESDVTTAGRLEDIENTDITLLGKNYKLLNAYNATNLKLELMGGAVSDTLALDESKDYTVGNKTYTVKVGYVGQTGSTNEAKLEINGELTNKMNIGGTQKLKDGTQLGIRDILYQNFAGGVMKVEFSLGAEKLTIENGQKMKLNDVQTNDVVTYIGQGYSGAKATINNIVLAWVPNDKYFITESRSAVFPGLKSLTINTGNFTAPSSDTLKLINSGDKTMAIQATIKSGAVTIPILYGNGTAFSKIGDESSTGTLDTGGVSGLQVSFNRTTDREFVASWTSGAFTAGFTSGTGTAAESYLLRATVSKDVPTTGVNSTDIIDVVTGNTVCQQKQTAQTCTIGNVVLTINSIDINVDGTVNITGASSVVFNKLYTVGGMRLNLPLDSPMDATLRPGAINFSGSGVAANITTWNAMFEESDKDHNIGLGQDINATVGWASGKIEVSATPTSNFAPYNGATTATSWDLGGSSSTSNYVNYVSSDTGSRVEYYTKPDQDYIVIENHGGQSYGNVFITSPSVTVTSSTSSTGGSVQSLGSVIYKDSESSSFANNNIIVVGGSCINSAAADLLGSTTPVCGDDFTTKTTVAAGQFLIQTYSRTGGKMATLVAGFNAADTQNAAKYLITQTVDTSAGKKYVGTSATSAEVVTTTA